jgi:hypothetical protein
MSDRCLEFFLKTILTLSIASINFYDCKVKRNCFWQTLSRASAGRSNG